MFRIILILLFLYFSFLISNAQGPEISYYHNDKTNLTWTSANISFKSGSTQKTPFVPVINSNYCPYGTGNYAKDVKVSGKLVLLSGLKSEKIGSSGCLAGKVILMPYCRASEEPDFLEQIRRLCQMDIEAVVLFSVTGTRQTLNFQDKELTSSNVPIIFITHKTACEIFAASGMSFPKISEKKKEDVFFRELICSFHLNMKGDFEEVQSEFRTIRFNDNLIDSSSIKELGVLTDSAMSFVARLFAPINPVLFHQTVTCFSDFDEKIFYTSHWGRGMATQHGNFSVFEEKLPAYELAVHEMTHSVFYKNWGETISFLDEGIAMYAEAKSGDPDKNHKKTAKYLTNKELLPLEELLKIDIGADKRFTEMGYAAAGSFTGFLIESYGMKKFLNLWVLGINWEGVYHKTTFQLERDWHQWLASQNPKQQMIH
ncbi:hypothetical protein BY457_10715 [Marinilabilia salmonicolor]|jgi:hypothetical protein|nr:hypothetical protein BY457_10715 [Marinilabilia salmonicolor]